MRILELQKMRQGGTPLMIWGLIAAASISGAPLSVPASVLATGSNSSADGYLDVGVDEYGAWASASFGGSGDHFNPLGAPTLQEAAFTSGLFVFIPNRSQRELLTDNANWQGVLPDDASLSRSVTTPVSPFDTTGNGINDSATSAFNVTGTGTALSFELAQHVGSGDPGVAIISQTYRIRNDDSNPIEFSLLRSFDGDLLWSGGFENDEVGTSMHSSGSGTYVFEQEASLPSTTAITLSTPGAANYYGGKHGLTPGLGGPTYDFGTDTEQWNAFGIPASWINHIAGVGYDTNGVSGTAPAGSSAPQDGFMGLGIDISLAPGEERVIKFLHTYGQNVPVAVPASVPEPGPLSLFSLGLVGLGIASRRRKAGPFFDCFRSWAIYCVRDHDYPAYRYLKWSRFRVPSNLKGALSK